MVARRCVEVDGADELVGNRLEGAVLVGWGERPMPLPRRPWKFDRTSVTTDPAMACTRSNGIAVGVVEGWGLRCIGAARCRSGPSYGGARARGSWYCRCRATVDEPAGPGQVLERHARLGLERAMEPLILAERLGMIGARLADRNPGFDQPDGKGGEAAFGMISHGEPLSTAIRQGKAIRRKAASEMRFDGVGRLVGAGRQNHREARMGHPARSGMQPPGVHGHLPLKSICHKSFGQDVRSG